VAAGWFGRGLKTAIFECMEATINLDEFLIHGHETFLPHLSVDLVIFGFHENQLKVLLLKWREANEWVLPGGFIKKKESLDDSAIRILNERTGLDKIFLQQFHAFGDPDRERNKGKMKILGKSKGWLMERFVTIGYYALVEFSKVAPKPDSFSEACAWWDLDAVPTLIYDHKRIMEAALTTLRSSLRNYPAGHRLLPEKFTMPELQRLYETILGRSLDRRNFQKKMLGMNVLDRLKERKIGGAHKAPYLYKFNLKKYTRASLEGVSADW
jgi:8-oxo-dGTP diphosphatase